MLHNKQHNMLGQGSETSFMADSKRSGGGPVTSKKEIDEKVQSVFEVAPKKPIMPKIISDPVVNKKSPITPAVTQTAKFPKELIGKLKSVPPMYYAIGGGTLLLAIYFLKN